MITFQGNAVRLTEDQKQADVVATPPAKPEEEDVDDPWLGVVAAMCRDQSDGTTTLGWANYLPEREFSQMNQSPKLIFSQGADSFGMLLVIELVRCTKQPSKIQDTAET